jgi:hypothetical protein
MRRQKEKNKVLRRALVLRLCLLVLVLPGWSGCHSSEALWEVGSVTGGVAAGALAGKAISDDPWVIAGGAAAGGAAGAGLNSLRKRKAEEEFLAGYEQGLSDSVKRQYWIQAGMQRALYQQKGGDSQ